MRAGSCLLRRIGSCQRVQEVFRCLAECQLMIVRLYRQGEEEDNGMPCCNSH